MALSVHSIAVLASLDRSAIRVLWVLGLVVVAAQLGDAVVVSEFE
jgi:hypothetical protein